MTNQPTDNEWKLEPLLNRLIEMWNYYWFGLRTKEIHIFWTSIQFIQYNGVRNQREDNRYNLNDLCSLDSGFWQFVCEKGLYSSCEDVRINDSLWNEYNMDDFNFWLMRSAIEKDKVAFILDNVKLPDEK